MCLPRPAAWRKWRKRFVFTTHTPEEAGNEKMDVNTMNTFSFFDGLSMEQVRAAVGLTDNTFNYTLAALRLSHIANGVSKLHGEVSRQMWKDYEGVCPIIHITNAQNQKYCRTRNWAEAFQARNKEAFIRPQARPEESPLPHGGGTDGPRL